MKLFVLAKSSPKGAPADRVKKEGGKLVYNGQTFPGFNKPIKNTGKGKHKMLVLAKKGDRVRIVKFGHKDYEDYTTHKDKERRKNYHQRHKAIMLADGTPAWKDKFQAAHWALKVLW